MDRDAGLFEQLRDDGLHLVLQTGKRRFNPQHRKLKVQHQQVEPLGVLVVV